MTPRIGIVGYLNARPLTDDLDRERYQVIADYPCHIARMLQEGEVDVALAPIAAVLSHPELRILPGWCIGAEGPVASVLLVAETPPEHWTRVVLDGESRTSAVLAQLLLREGPLADVVSAELEIVQGEPGVGIAQAEGTTASLVIGDAARQLPDRLTLRLDLAELWHQWTDLPFVFAVWAGRVALPLDLQRHIREAGALGTSAIGRRWSGRDRAYLQDDLRYPLDDAALMGMRRFASLAARAGLVGSDAIRLVQAVPWQGSRANVDRWLAKAVEGERLSGAEALALAQAAPLTELGAAADLRRQLLCGSPMVEVVLQAELGAHAEPESVAGAVEAGASRLALVGATSLERVAQVAARYPGVELQALTVGDEVEGYAAAGLRRVFDDPVGCPLARVRTAMGGPSTQALEGWWRRVAAEGLKATATLAVGQGESLEDRVLCLLRLRALQDELGVFEAFRCWAAFGDGGAGEEANTAEDYLRMVALGRLVLDNIPSCQGSPSTEGLGMAQASLRMGCDHLGVITLTGEVEGWPLQLKEARRFITAAGFEPRVEHAHGAQPTR